MVKEHILLKKHNNNNFKPAIAIILKERKNEKRTIELLHMLK